MGETEGTPTIIVKHEKGGVGDTHWGLLLLVSVSLPELWAYLPFLCVFEQKGTLASTSVTPLLHGAAGAYRDEGTGPRPLGELGLVGEGGALGKEGLLLEKLHHETRNGVWCIWTPEVHTDVRHSWFQSCDKGDPFRFADFLSAILR